MMPNGETLISNSIDFYDLITKLLQAKRNCIHQRYRWSQLTDIRAASTSARPTMASASQHSVRLSCTCSVSIVIENTKTLEEEEEKSHKTSRINNELVLLYRHNLLSLSNAMWNIHARFARLCFFLSFAVAFFRSHSPRSLTTRCCCFWSVNPILVKLLPHPLLPVEYEMSNFPAILRARQTFHPRELHDELQNTLNRSALCVEWRSFSSLAKVWRQ